MKFKKKKTLNVDLNLLDRRHLFEGAGRIDLFLAKSKGTCELKTIFTMVSLGGKWKQK